MGLNWLVRTFPFLLILVSAEVMELNRNNPPNVALAGFEFVVMNYVDSSQASKDSTKVFEAAETIFQQSSKRADKIGWAQLNVDKYPELAQVPEGMNLPAQHIVGYGQVISIRVADLAGETADEKGESFSNDVKRFTKETF